jgi:hypothetical protein
MRSLFTESGDRLIFSFFPRGLGIAKEFYAGPVSGGGRSLRRGEQAGIRAGSLEHGTGDNYFWKMPGLLV